MNEPGNFQNEKLEIKRSYPVTEKFLLIKVVPFVWIARLSIQQIEAIRIDGDSFSLKIRLVDGSCIYPDLDYEEEELDKLLE